MPDAIHKAQRDMQKALQSGEHLFTSLGMTDVDVEGVDLAIEMPVTPSWPTVEEVCKAASSPPWSTWWQVGWR